ncbi:MAG: DUF4097 family beta strand repeat protein, partial [Ignavibacteriales bacterium]|nr:DUF4097 family beta strand repeat protein [Ignavibacteriales bacterium]
MKSFHQTLAFFVTLLLLSVSVLPAQKRNVEERGVRSKSFTVSKGGTLEVNASVGDIRISPWDKGEVHVEVDGIDEEDLDRLRMTQTGNSVRVSFRPRWGDYGDVRFEINVPSQFDVELKTSGGNIEIAGNMSGKINGSTAGGDIKLKGDIGGTVDMSTSGGDVEVRNITGDGFLKTSGGDIRIGSVNGELEAGTSGGDIDVEKVGKSLNAKTAGGDIRVGDVGGEAKVSTAGGDIKMGKVSGKASMSTAGGNIELKGASGTVSAKTAGGDIRIENVTGTIEAKTSGGEVDAELIPSGKGSSRLVSAGGKIKLAVPENTKATIEARIQIHDRWRRYKEKYKIRSTDFKADSYEMDEDEEEIRATYKLNGGGETIYLETVNADIEIK